MAGCGKAGALGDFVEAEIGFLQEDAGPLDPAAKDLAAHAGIERMKKPLL